MSDNNYPVQIVLRFADAACRDGFLGGLSDGFGEEFVSIHRAGDVVDVDYFDDGKARKTSLMDTVTEAIAQREQAIDAARHLETESVFQKVRHRLEVARLAAELEAAKAAVPKWIAVTPETMPEEGVQVNLLYTHSCGRLFDLARLKGNRWKNSFWPRDERLADGIFSHWCAIPSTASAALAAKAEKEAT